MESHQSEERPRNFYQAAATLSRCLLLSMGWLQARTNTTRTIQRSETAEQRCALIPTLVSTVDYCRSTLEDLAPPSRATVCFRKIFCDTTMLLYVSKAIL